MAQLAPVAALNSSVDWLNLLKRAAFNFAWSTILHIIANTIPLNGVGGILEEHWNGEILDSIEKTIDWASTMTWKGIKPVIHFCDKIYQKGIKLTKKEMRAFERKILRSYSLPKWDVIINPLSG